jgi:hypothetical protein
MDEEQVNKVHRGKKSGPSADKKQAKKIAKSGGQSLKGKNPKVIILLLIAVAQTQDRLLQSIILKNLEYNLEGLLI